jgi:hypothetical protein
MCGDKRENSFAFGWKIIGIRHCISNGSVRIGPPEWTAITGHSVLRAKE